MCPRVGPHAVQHAPSALRMTDSLVRPVLCPPVLPSSPRLTTLTVFAPNVNQPFVKWHYVGCQCAPQTADTRSSQWSHSPSQANHRAQGDVKVCLARSPHVYNVLSRVPTGSVIAAPFIAKFNWISRRQHSINSLYPHTKPGRFSSSSPGIDIESECYRNAVHSLNIP